MNTFKDIVKAIGKISTASEKIYDTRYNESPGTAREFAEFAADNAELMMLARELAQDFEHRARFFAALSVEQREKE